MRKLNWGTFYLSFLLLDYLCCIFLSELLQKDFVVFLGLRQGQFSYGLNSGEVEAHVLLEEGCFRLSVAVFVGNATSMDNFGDFLSFVYFPF